MTFLLPFELADPEVRPGLERAAQGARASGTPFISFFTPTEMLALAREAGFREAQHVSAATLTQRCYFRGPNRWPASAEQRRGASGGDDVGFIRKPEGGLFAQKWPLAKWRGASSAPETRLRKVPDMACPFLDRRL